MEHYALASSLGLAPERRNEHRLLGGRPGPDTRSASRPGRRGPDRPSAPAYVICRVADTVIRRGLTAGSTDA